MTPTTEMTDQFIRPSIIHEQLFVGYLWKNPSLYQKFTVHTIEKTTFTDDKWFFFYWLGKQMYESGIRTFDDVTTFSYIDSRKETKGKGIKHYYESFGGFDEIKLLQDECEADKENDEYHFSEIQKYETLRTFAHSGLIDVQNTDLVKKLLKMNLNQLKLFFQYKHKEAFKNINSGEVVEHDLVDQLDDTIETMDAGETMGLPFYGTPRLNKTVKGWKDGTLMYLVLSSGMGKTSFSMYTAVMSLLVNNEKGIVFANEEGILKWRTLLLATTATTMINKPISRSKLAEGHYDDATKAKLYEARDWLYEHRRDMIKFFELTKYRVDDVIGKIELFRAKGYSKVIFDTFKPELTAGESARWEAFSNSAQKLHDCIKEGANNCGTLATIQLKIGKEYRTLDLSTIGKSLEIVEVAGVVMMGRLLYHDEYEGGKNPVYAYNWDEEVHGITGKWKKKRYLLNPEKQYMLLFIAKNREGSADIGIVYEVNYTFNSWKEVAYFDVIREARNI